MIFETDKDIIELASRKFEETSLPQMGVQLKVISVTKAKNILKISKAGATMQYLTKKDVILVVYEEAFDRLTDEHKEKLLEGAFSNVDFDTERDKINVENDIAKEIFRMRRKYNDYVDIMEASYVIVSQIEEEEKERKEAEKIRKAEERAARKRNNN